MARIRSAKPDFWTDPLMSSLVRDIRFTFKGLWEVCADDFGRFLADSRVIKGKIWPTDDDISPKKIERYLESLASCGRIILYTVDGVRYGYIVNWLKHQRVSHPSPSNFPDPPPESLRRNSGNTPESLPKNSALSGAEAERSGLGVGVGVGFRSGAERESFARNGEPNADDLDPEIRDTDRAASPAPLVALPVDAERLVEQLYSLSTDKRRLDVRRQLYDALDPRLRGARLRRGVFVKARSPEHLAACCRAVLEDPPRNIDAAIVIVLEKLLDPPPGPTASERHKADLESSTQEEELYQREARRAGVAWANEHPDAYAPIVESVDKEFAEAGVHGSSGSAFVKLARDAALSQRTAAAAGFPSFSAWKKERADRAEQSRRSA